MISIVPAARRPFARMQHIHEKLCAAAPINANIVARELETSARTIQRDLDFMRDSFGLPIEYDRSERTLYYSQPVSGSAFGFGGEPECTAVAVDTTLLLLDEQPAEHLAVICERHGLRSLDVLRAVVGETLADAVCNSTLMAAIVRAARVLATNGREAA